MYRSTEKKPDHTGHDLAKLDYFRTHAPYEWRNSEKSKEAFAAIYGEDALAYAMRTALVPENINPVWVGGTYWSDPARRVRPVYGDEEGLVSGGEFPKPGVAPEITQILAELAEIKSMVGQLLAK